MMVMGAIDLNHNRHIDADEMDKAASSVLTLDRNGDGRLQPDEYLTQSDLSRGDYKMFRLYLVLHPDSNGVVTRESMANIAKELKALDANGDGSLDPQEFGPPGAPPPPDMNGNQQGGPNGQGGPPNQQGGFQGGPPRQGGPGGPP